MHKEWPEYKAFKACFPRSEEQPMTPDLRATYLARETAAHSGLRHGWSCSRVSKALELGRSCLSSWRPSVARMACVLCSRRPKNFRPHPMRVAAVCETDPGYIGRTWYNGVALCGTPAACILAAAAIARLWSWWPSQGVKKR